VVGSSYAIFIVGAYGAAAVIVAALIAWIVLDRRQLVRLINELEAKGVARRSVGAGLNPASTGERDP
jgi:heme exporter protein CcmD